MAIEVTVRDTESGESETSVIEDDYILVTAGSCFVGSWQDYPKSGTHVVTIKGRHGRSAS